MFAFADRTAAWSAEASPFLERETTMLAKGWLRNKAPGMHGLRNMLKMIEGFSFFNPEHFRNLSQIKTFPFKGFSNLFPQS
jgi:hypothetical protein